MWGKGGKRRSVVGRWLVFRTTFVGRVNESIGDAVNLEKGGDFILLPFFSPFGLGFSLLISPSGT